MINLKEKGVILQLAPVKDFRQQGHCCESVASLLATLSLDVQRGRDEAQGPEKGQAAPEMLGEQRKCGFRLPVNASVLRRAGSLASAAVCDPLISSPPASCTFGCLCNC